MESPVHLPKSPSNKPRNSCLRCADRKVRCDRQDPCSACTKHQAQCVFRAPPAPRRKQKRSKESKLEEKLKHYEALLQKHGVDPNPSQVGLTNLPEAVKIEDASQLPPTPTSAAGLLERSITNSQLLHGEGRSKFVDNLWSRVVEEFHDPREAMEESSYEESDASESDEDLGFILSDARTPDLRPSHPPTEQIHQLWQIFIENFDPLTKIVHVPSLQPAMHKAASNIEKVPRTFEALMFAIYAAAVTSLREEQCKQMLGGARDALVSHYTSATKAALSRAKFMGTTSIVVLQALTLHIFTVRNVYEPRTIWTLTGVAIRIAQGMGLDRDGLSLGLPHFETEIRRRLWWNIKMHNTRAAELAGLAKFRGFEADGDTCQPPANINDNDLYPGMLSPAASSAKLTNMCFLALKVELSQFAQRNIVKFRVREPDPSQWDDMASRSDRETKDVFIKEIEEIVESKYLRYCDPTKPLQLLTMLMARYALNVVRFLTDHPRRWVNQEEIPDTERERLWEVSVSLLEQHDLVQSERRLQGFAWNSGYFLQWHAFIHVLDTLRARPLQLGVEKAWRLVEATYENNPDMISNTRRPINVAVGNLCLKAFTAYEGALIRERSSIARVPNFITQLRQQREAAKAKRSARDTRNEETGAMPTYNTSHSTEVVLGADPQISPSADRRHADDSQQDRQLTNQNQTVDSDPFWLSSGLDSGLYGTSGDMMNVDTDSMLAQDDSSGAAIGDPINWTQWDAWISDPNVIRANMGMAFWNRPAQLYS